MDNYKLDEAIKIKKLKEAESFTSPSKTSKNKRPLIAILGFILGFTMFICVTLTIASTLFKKSTIAIATPTSAQPVAIALAATSTPSPLPRGTFDLNINALSAQLTPNTSSTISFEINFATVENNLCSGIYEITDMSQLQLVHQENLSEEKDSTIKGMWLGLVAWDGIDTGHALGEEIPLYDGETGITQYHLANAPNFRHATNRFTDGVNDWVILTTDFMDGQNRRNGGSSIGISEWKFFDTGADLQAHAIKLIEREINSLIIQPNYYSFDVTWKFWGPKEQDPNHWLYITPTIGTLNPGEKQIIEVTFSSKTKDEGQYTTELIIDYGENCSQPTTIPVTLIVTNE